MSATVQVNGRPMPLDETDLAAWLTALGYPADRPGIAVAVNGHVVPRKAWRGHRLAAGDRVEIVGAVQGG